MNVWKKFNNPSLAKRTTAMFLVFVMFVTIAYAVYYTTFALPQQAGIGEVYATEVYINDSKRTSGVTYDWGNGTTSVNLQVKNTGNTNVSIYLIISGLPLGWSETWSGNGTLPSVPPNWWQNGTLTLTRNGIAGVYSWNSWIKVEKA